MNIQNESPYKNKIVTIPNILSFARLCMIPVFVWLYSFKHAYTAATILLAVSALTDLVDGFIARKFNMISDLGKALDPIADKLTQLTTLICLIFRFPLMLIPATILTVKELFTGIIGLVNIKKTKKVPSAVWHGKITTTLLYAMMIVHVVWSSIPQPVSVVMISVCAFMMFVSAILYGIFHFKAILNTKKD